MSNLLNKILIIFSLIAIVPGSIAKKKILHNLRYSSLSDDAPYTSIGEESKPLKLSRRTESTNGIPCKSGDAQTCVCPGPCMNHVANTTYCDVKKCYKWDANLGKCEDDGPAFMPAIILQAIPFTGVFGSGFGNMGRWDLFGVAMGIFFGGLVLACIFICLCNDTNDDNGKASCSVSCYTCLLSIAITTYWIWGIVVIANKSILGPNGCKLS